MSDDVRVDSLGAGNRQGLAAVGGGESERLFQVTRYWRVAVLGALFCLGVFREELLALFVQWSKPEGAHGWLIPGFSLYFLYQSRHELKQARGSVFWPGLLVLLGGVVGYFYVGVIQNIYTLRPLMMIVTLLGLLLFVGGWAIFRLTWLPAAYLIFALPLPSPVYYGITMPLRKLASWITAMFIDLLPETSCQAVGVVIQGMHQGDVFTLNVAEACSGMRLLMAFVALGVAMAYLEYRPVIHRAVLLVSTIPIAVFCNVVRVFLTGIIHIYVGREYAEGMLHTLLGMAMLFLAFGCYGGLAWLMNRMVVEEDDSDSAEGMLVVGGGNAAKPRDDGGGES